MSQQGPDVFTPFMRKVAALYRPFGLSEERLKQVADQIPMWALILGGVVFLALFVFLLVGAAVPCLLICVPRLLANSASIAVMSSLQPMIKVILIFNNDARYLSDWRPGGSLRLKKGLPLGRRQLWVCNQL